VDLGAGSGALTQYLRDRGWDVTGVDRDVSQWRSSAPVVAADLDHDDLTSMLGTGYDLILAVEVIEHLEAPIAFLRAVKALLGPSGIAVVTTPNLDSLASRMKFLLKDKLRGMDELGDLTHISPIFWDLLHRQYLPRAGLILADRQLFPPMGYVSGRPSYRALLNGASRLLRGRMRGGDNLVLVLSASRRAVSGVEP
jgi:SAM-dependent methyltransferase